MGCARGSLVGPPRSRARAEVASTISEASQLNEDLSRFAAALEAGEGNLKAGALELVQRAERLADGPDSGSLRLRAATHYASAVHRADGLGPARQAYETAVGLAAGTSGAARLCLGGGAAMWVARDAFANRERAVLEPALRTALVMAEPTPNLEDGHQQLARLLRLEARALLAACYLEDGRSREACHELETSDADAGALLDDNDIAHRVAAFCQHAIGRLVVRTGFVLWSSSSRDAYEALIAAFKDADAGSWRDQAAVRWGEALGAMTLGDYEEALDVVEAALYLVPDGIPGDDEIAVVGELQHLAAVAADRIGNHGFAMTKHELALRNREQVHDPLSEPVIDSRYCIAEMARVTGDANAAARLLDELWNEVRDLANPPSFALKQLIAKNRVLALKEAGEPPSRWHAAYEDAMRLGMDGALREQLLTVACGDRWFPDGLDALAAEVEKVLAELKADPHADDKNARVAQLSRAFGGLVPFADAAPHYQMAFNLLAEPSDFSERYELCTLSYQVATRLLEEGRPTAAYDVLASSSCLIAFVELSIERWRVRSALSTLETTNLWRALFLELAICQVEASERIADLAFWVAVTGMGMQADALRYQREVAPKDATGEIDINALVNRMRRRRAWDASFTDEDRRSLHELENFVARSVASTAFLVSVNRSQPRAVGRALPPDSALVQFVRFERSYERDAAGHSTTAYAAFVVHAGTDNAPEVRMLGPSEPIDNAIAALRSSIKRPGGPGSVWHSHADRLAELIWRPLETHVGRPRWTFVVPDGPLAAVPFDALPGGDGAPLITQHALVLLGNCRDVHRFRGHARTPAPPVVIADPECGPPGSPFAPLRGAADEGARVAMRLGVTAVTGPDATRSLLLDARDPEILHLATHGYYLEADRDSDVAATDPLLLTGLALAGANNVSRRFDDVAVVSGLDALGLALMETDLVVLSACDTGLGPARSGEGLLSLGRSFVLAGARTVVWSLWPLDDERTVDVVDGLYRRLLEGQPKAQALRATKLEAFHARPERIDVWAGLVMQGDPLPLLRFRDLPPDADEIPPEELSTWRTDREPPPRRRNVKSTPGPSSATTASGSSHAPTSTS